MEPSPRPESDPLSDLDLDQPLDPSPTDLDLVDRLRSASEGLRLLERLWPSSLDTLPDPSTPTPASASQASTAEPPRFGRFRIVRELGRGGFGVVFLAIDPDLGRLVALKVPRPEWLLDAPVRERFLREARAVAALDHPGIAPLYEAGERHGVCYMASAYCEGPDLAAWLRERKAPVAPRTAARIAARLADAIAHAHQRGVLHRDLKPSNVLLARHPSDDDTDDAEALLPRIVDFGLARLLDQAADDVTASFAAAGTVPYMAPEQAGGHRVGPAADVYGLGAVLYSMLCGRPPRRGAADDVVPPRSIRPEIPRDLEAVCLKCLEKDPARRYATAGLLRDDLQRHLDGLPTLARSGARWNRVRRVWRRHRLVLALLAIVGAIVSGVFWYEDRVQKAVELAQHRDEEARQVRLSARRTRYDADLRLARERLHEHNVREALAILDRNRPRSGETDLREFSWRYLRRLSDQSRQTLRGFSRAVYSVEFSPSGDRLAAASQDGTVRVWETGTWRTLLAFRADRQEANAATFSPDGRSLATVGDEGSFRLWDLATGRPRLKRPAHRGDAVIARFSPDGRNLLTGGRKDGQIAIWNLHQCAEMTRLDAHPTDFEAATFSPDGRFLATIGSGSVRLWDFARRTMVAERVEPGTLFQGAAFSHDGHCLAVTNRRVVLLNLPSLTVRRELDSHLDGVFAAAFSADDQTVFSAGEDGLIRAWDTSTGKLRWTRQGHTGKVWGLSLSPDGQTLASASTDGTVKLWDARPPLDRQSLTLPGTFAAIRLSGDGQRFAAIDPTGQWTIRATIDGRLLESRDLLALPSAGHPLPRPPIQAVIADDLRTLLLAGADGGVWAWSGERASFLTGPAPGTTEPIPLNLRLDASGRRALIVHPTTWRLEYWEIPSARRIDERTGPYGDAYLFPDGRRVAIVPHGWRPPILWEPGVAGRVSSPSGRSFNPVRLAFSPDGRWLAHRDHLSEPGRHEIVLRETERLAVIPVPIHSTARAWSLAFDPIGRTLAGGCEDQSVHIWDMATGEEILTLGPLPGVPGHLQYLDEGRTLAAILARPDGTTELSFWRTDLHPK